MAMALVGYWVIGAPIGVALAFLTPLGGFGLWIGLAVGLTAVALMLFVRWRGKERAGFFRRRLREAGMTPLILDVDTGIDDAFALLYALGRAGRATARRLYRRRQRRPRHGDPQHARRAGARRPRRHSRLAGRGLAAARRSRATPATSTAQTGLGYAVLPEPGAGRRRPPHAVDAILAAAREHEGELVLVATGPLTNIALAVARDPELPRRLARFVVMGGAFRESGNVDGGGRVQHLARSRGGANRLPRLRRAKAPRRRSWSAST